MSCQHPAFFPSLQHLICERVWVVLHPHPLLLQAICKIGLLLGHGVGQNVSIDRWKHTNTNSLRISMTAARSLI